ncbi:MAG TPA: HAD hydrolase-like protein [Bryobacteraceae bacterium]|jgi:HAD superfamily hydrolase (TIGR01548 family)
MPAKKTAIIFDVDGVLVDPERSYRQTVVETVAHFEGGDAVRITLGAIEDYKNEGGYNNDWLLTQRILKDRGIDVDYGRVIEQFNRIFFGENHDGLILEEQWLVEGGLLERLSAAHQLAVFTGRLDFEAALTLKRFAPEIEFVPRVCSDHLENPKPAPDGLFAIRKALPETTLIYIGDTVDDARPSRLAGIPFIGVAKRNHLRRAELMQLFEDEGAAAVIENVNEIEGAIAKILNGDAAR